MPQMMLSDWLVYSIPGLDTSILKVLLANLAIVVHLDEAAAMVTHCVSHVHTRLLQLTKMNKFKEYLLLDNRIILIFI